jgi:hypothetical protein
MPRLLDGDGVPPEPQSGLNVMVREAIRDALDELLLIWRSVPTLDYQKVHRPTGPGAFEIRIEPYRGWRTSMTFYDTPTVAPIVAKMRATLSSHQPELVGCCYFPGGMHAIFDTTGVALHWCREVVARMDRGVTQHVAIDELLDDLEYLLVKNRMSVDVFTPLYGLKFPDGVYEINLDEDVSLVELSNEFFSELTNADIEMAPFDTVAPHNLGTAVRLRTTAEVRLEKQLIEGIEMDTEVHRRAQEVLTNVLVTLHVVASGQAAPVGTYLRYERTPLPPLSGANGRHPLSTNPYASMHLEAAALIEIQRTYRAVIDAPANVRIAAARLHDAVRRTSPVDALLDSIIGLEVLLNPRDDRELSFRVALNYAFMGPQKERHDRYVVLKNIQSMRNKVVHGGLNMHSKEAIKLVEQADLAKACLRETLNEFLFNPIFSRGNLTAEFWTSLVMPS